MKKLALLFVVCAGLTIASCGNKTANAVSSDSDTVLVDTVDSVALDSMVCPD